MIKEIVKDTNILTQKSRDFNFETDIQVITDLLDTAKANEKHCAGLAAIQINEAVKAFVIKTKSGFKAYINPIIAKRSPQIYTTSEGCLSLDGERTVKRNRWILVAYKTETGKFVSERLEGFIAQVFQHEYQHTLGQLI